jgi:protein-disulfide isomerase
MSVIAALALLFTGQYVEGNPRATLRVVIYEDLQCPDCAAFRQILDNYLLPRYGGQVAFEHRDFPLPKHSWARQAAVAARHFERVRPGAGVEFRRFMLSRIKDTPLERLEERVREFAREISLDPTDAVAALRSTELDELVEQDYQEGIARGVKKTPTVYVNDVVFVEKIRRGEVGTAIEKALAQ